MLMPISVSAGFCFTSSTSAKRFPFEDFFIRETKKGHSGQDQVTREGRARGDAIFGQKLMNTQHGVDRCARKSPT